MADRTLISWTDATWQVTYGCDRVSPGCTNCYAIRTMNRLAHNPNPTVSENAAGLVGLTIAEDGEQRLDWTGEVRLLPANLGTPLRWRKPRRIFVDSQADLFHKDVPAEYIARVFAVMACAPQHVFQVLTKRHARLRTLLNDPRFRATVYDLAAVEYDQAGMFDPFRYDLAGVFTPVDYEPNPAHRADGSDWWPLPNVHIGVSVEDQHWAEIRIPALLDTSAAVRWISAEPMLGPIDLHHADDGRMTYWLTGRPDWVPDEGMPTSSIAIGSRLDWVVTGGESGSNANPAHPSWFRTLRDQCADAGVAFQFKQWGEWSEVGPDSARQMLVAPDGTAYAPRSVVSPGGRPDRQQGVRVLGDRYREALQAGHTRLAVMYRVGKRTAGRELDDVVHDAFQTVLTGSRGER